MKILVTGAGGMLGSGFVPALVAAGHEVRASDIRRRRGALPWGPDGPELEHLDVRVRAEVDAAFAAVRPDLVCHLAAETDLEVCENDPDHAFLTNTVGTKLVVLAAQRAGIPLAYISTAGVFDGEKELPYNEWDDPNPLTVYGRSKFEGERIVETFLDRFYIVRAGWMVGGGDVDHKFVARILDQIRDGRTTLHAVGDKHGTPTYVPDFARCFCNLMTTDSWGRYHMACEGAGTRYDVTARILEVLGLAGDIELIEVNSDFFKEEFPAPRPASEIMRNLHLELQGLNTMRSWSVALAEYLLANFADLARNVDPDARRLDSTRRTEDEELQAS